MQEQIVILTKKQIDHKIKRIAYQVYETNVNEKEVIIAGIQSNGYTLAKKLKNAVEKISPIKVTLCEVTINKKRPTDAIETSLLKQDYTNKSLLLVDDVLHSGTTLVMG